MEQFGKESSTIRGLTAQVMATKHKRAEVLYCPITIHIMREQRRSLSKSAHAWYFAQTHGYGRATYHCGHWRYS